MPPRRLGRLVRKSIEVRLALIRAIKERGVDIPTPYTRCTKLGLIYRVNLSLGKCAEYLKTNTKVYNIIVSNSDCKLLSIAIYGIRYSAVTLLIFLWIINLLKTIVNRISGSNLLVRYSSALVASIAPSIYRRRLTSMKLGSWTYRNYTIYDAVRGICRLSS